MFVLEQLLLMLGTLGAMDLVGILLLALQYFALADYNKFPVPKLFAIKWILVTGLPGYTSSYDKEFGLFWRHIQVRMDSHRSNAGSIAECRANLRRLHGLPRTSVTFRAIEDEEAKLQALRAYDNVITATIGVGALAPDLAVTANHVAADADAVSDAEKLAGP